MVLNNGSGFLLPLRDRGTIVVQSDVGVARSATVLVPSERRVGGDLPAGNGIRLMQQFGVGVDVADLTAARNLGIPITNAPSELTRMGVALRRVRSSLCSRAQLTRGRARRH
jgi:phosphoglycerate dehydrogenase-like enzyme